MLPIADASDGAGSIRVPAAVNGLVGLKPCRGRMTFAPDLVDFWYGGAQFFAVSRTVRDTAAMLDAVKGSLPGEPYHLPSPERSYLSEVKAGVRNLRIGFSTHNARGDKNAAEVVASVENAARLCEALGHSVEEFKFDYDFHRIWRVHLRHLGSDRRKLRRIHPEHRAKVKQDELTKVTWISIERGRATSAVRHSLDTGLSEWRRARLRRCVTMRYCFARYRKERVHRASMTCRWTSTFPASRLGHCRSRKAPAD
jgi:amidase